MAAEVINLQPSKSQGEKSHHFHPSSQVAYKNPKSLSKNGNQSSTHTPKIGYSNFKMQITLRISVSEVWAQ